MSFNKILSYKTKNFLKTPKPNPFRVGFRVFMVKGLGVRVRVWF